MGLIIARIIMSHFSQAVYFQVPGSTSNSIDMGVDLLETASSRLELTGIGGSPTAVRLRCEATVFRLYRANSLEVEVRPESPQPASVLLLETSWNRGNIGGILKFLFLMFGSIQDSNRVMITVRSTSLQTCLVLILNNVVQLLFSKDECAWRWTMKLVTLQYKHGHADALFRISLNYTDAELIWDKERIKEEQQRDQHVIHLIKAINNNA